MELCGTAIVFWTDSGEYRDASEKIEDLDQFEGDCNKEKYIQRVVLLEQGRTPYDSCGPNNLRLCLVWVFFPGVDERTGGHLWRSQQRRVF